MALPISKKTVKLLFLIIGFAGILQSKHTYAGVFYLLISADDGIETVDEIYEEYNQGVTPQTMLTIFNEFPPESVEYLQSFNRPATPPANPDSSAGRIYRRLQVSYLYPMGVTEVMDYFQSSSLVETVSYDGNLEPIIFTPEIPGAGDDVVMDVVLFPEFCGNMASTSPNPQGLIFDVNRVNNNITLDVSIHIYPPGQPVACFGERPYYQFDLGQLQPGNYQIQINLVSDSTSFPASDSDRTHLADTTLIIQGTGTPIPVPIKNNWMLIFLSVVFWLIAMMLMPKLRSQNKVHT